MATKTLQPAEWARPKGYANGMAARGQMIFISGQVGWDANGQFHSDNLTEQVAQALRNIVRVLEEAQAQPRHLVRLTWYVLSRDAYVREVREIGAAYRELGARFSAMSVVAVSGFGRAARTGGDRGDGRDPRRLKPMATGRPAGANQVRAARSAPWPTSFKPSSRNCSSRSMVGSVRLAARTWVPAMVPWRATEEGDVTPSVLAWYERFARGRPAALVVEATGVRDVASGPRCASAMIASQGLERLTQCVRRASNGETKLFIQIIDFLSIRRRPTAHKYFERFLKVTPRHREFPQNDRQR